MSTLLIVTNNWDEAAWARAFQALVPEVHTVTSGEPFDPASITYAAAWKHPPGALARLTNLKAIFSLGAGVDHLFADPNLPAVPLVRVIDADLRDRMSEWVVLNVLLHQRQVPRYQAQQRARLWADDDRQPAARSVRVGVMGAGVLGRDAIFKLRLLGFDVAGWGRSRGGSLDDFLARTDILVCLLPLTAQTRGILNRGLFERLARDGRLPGPVLINGGRGGLHVEADILRSLDDGTLHAASLDVFETEPLPPASPLWDHPRVLVTPHNAAMSEPEAVASQIANNIQACERGEAMKGVVDPALGY